MSQLQASEIKMIRSLQEKKFRREYGMFVVEGEKMVEEALSSEFEVVKVYRRDEIGEQTMGRISSLKTAPPVLATVRTKKWPLEMPGKGKLYLGLDSVRDPGNLGTIIRLADWFGVEAIFASEDTVELYNPKTIQATMGAIFRKKLIYCNLKEVCSSFAKAGGKVYGTFLEGQDIYRESGFDAGGLVVMGNESDGISKEVAEAVTDRITIPSFSPEGNGSESLNVAIACAVTVSEFRRAMSRHNNAE